MTFKEKLKNCYKILFKNKPISTITYGAKVVRCNECEYNLKCDKCVYKLLMEKHCKNNTCKICEFKELLDKQKNLEAEYSRLLSSSLEQFQKGYNRGYDDAYKVAKVEAYKEFADTLEKSILSQLAISTMEKSEAYYYCLDCIKNILQELTERKEDEGK